MLRPRPNLSTHERAFPFILELAVEYRPKKINMVERGPIGILSFVLVVVNVKPATLRIQSNNIK
jgi:hypothetical protein